MSAEVVLLLREAIRLASLERDEQRAIARDAARHVRSLDRALARLRMLRPPMRGGKGER